MWLKLFLVIAFGSTVLRLGPDSDLTLFRVLLPIAVLAFFVKNKSAMYQFFAICLAFLFFQIIANLVGGYPVTYLQFAFTGNYIIMFFLYFVIERRLRVGGPELYIFMAWAYCITVAALALQYFTDYQLPNVNDAREKLNGWYWNENDASLALAAFMVLGLRMGLSKRWIPIHLAALAIIAYNESRACLFGLGVYFGIWYFVLPLRRRSPVAFVTSMFAVVCLAVAGLYVWITHPGLVDGMWSELFRLFSRVFFLEEASFAVGSVDLRSNALVYAITEFIWSKGLGIGAGNSIAMLQSGKYPDMVYVLSIHNMPMQFLLELGAPFVIMLVALIKRSSPLDTIDFIFVVAVYLFISLSQSGGFLVNYFAMVCFFMALKMVPGRELASRDAVSIRRPFKPENKYVLTRAESGIASY